jgi:transcription antitermination factor NusG
MIKNLKKVSGFLGSKGTPIPVSDKEIEKILGEIKDGVAQPKSGVEYNVGEKVQVIDGPFASFSGLVEDIDEEKLRLKVSVSIFGRPTPVDLEYNQVEKILGQIKDGVAQPKSGIEYSVGEKVQVVDGPFASFSGMIEEIDEEKSRLKVSVSIFGRPTPVDLEYNQVEKAS